MKYRLTFIFLILLMIAPVASFGELTTYELYVGESLGLSAKLYEDNDEELDEDIKWTSSNSSIVTVKDGIITAVDKGFATVTYESNYGASVHAGSVYISVKPTVQSVELILPKNDMEVGETMTTDYIVQPVPNLDAPLVTDVTYSTSDAKVIKVDKSGVVTAVGEGTAYVYVETKDSHRKDFKQVTVETTVSSIQINESIDKLYVGETAQLSATVFPERAIEKGFYWDNSSHLDIDGNGVVTGKKSGTGYITVHSNDGDRTDSIKIQVVSMVEGIEISKEIKTIDEPTNTFQLKAELIPAITDTPPLVDKIIWKSNNTSVATVTSSGLVRVKKDGMVNITATSADGGHTDNILLKTKFNTNLEIPPTHIGLGSHNDIYQSGETFQISYILEPDDTTNTDVKYNLYGGNANIHHKDGYFEITCFDEGRYTFTVNTTNKITDSTTFTVESNLSGIDIHNHNLEKDPSSGRYIIYLGQSGKINHTLIKASDSSSILVNDIDWTSSDSNIVRINNDGEFYGRNIGHSILRIESKDSGYFKTLPVEVKGMAKEIQLPTYAEIGVDMTYDPTPYFIPKENLLYGLNQVIVNDYKVDIEEVSIPIEYIESEIAFEEERLDRLKNLINSSKGDKDTLEKLVQEREKSKQRKNDLRNFKSSTRVYDTGNDDSDYYVIISGYEEKLTDRNFNTLRVARTTNNDRAIEANFVSRIEFKVTSFDGELEDTMVVYADGKTSELRLYDNHGQVIESSEPIAQEALVEQSDEVKKEDQSELIKALKEDYTSLDANKRPSNETLIALDEADNLNLIQDAFKTNYRRGITRIEMAKLCLDIYDLNMPEVAGNFQHSIFTDTDDEIAIRAFQYGIVSASVDRKFNPNQVITREEMTHMFFRTLLAMNMDLNDDVTQEKSNYFLDEDMIEDAYTQAVGYLCYDHSVVTGITEDRFWPQVSAQIDYTIKYAMNILNALK